MTVTGRGDHYIAVSQYAPVDGWKQLARHEPGTSGAHAGHL